MTIHEQAIVSPSARIHPSVSIGPFTVIGPEVEIGAGTVVASHVVIGGPTVIGRNNHIYQFASVGEDCQDKKYNGEPTRLIMGDDNIIREYCSIHRGTVQDRGETTIGNGNLFMASSHVAHDCVVGNGTILANLATIAGHVRVDDFAILGGGTLVHQFCHIGTQSMCAGGSIVLKDVPAYVMAGGQSATAHGLNTEGLRRRDVSSESVAILRKAYKTLYRGGLTFEQAIVELDKLDADHESAELKVFIASLKRATRGIVR